MAAALATCTFSKASGDQRRARPMRDNALCFCHDPEFATKAAEARRHGGLRRRREETLLGAYDVEGVESVAQIRRVIDIVIFDPLRAGELRRPRTAPHRSGTGRDPASFLRASSRRYVSTALRVVNKSCPSFQAWRIPVRSSSLRSDALRPLWAAASATESSSLGSGTRRPRF
jgi:hypothetical protein